MAWVNGSCRELSGDVFRHEFISRLTSNSSCLCLTLSAVSLAVALLCQFSPRWLAFPRTLVIFTLMVSGGSCSRDVKKQRQSGGKLS
ncbi:hypothetical protein AG1IA_03888 [Rhizoctonia solani AG-1 IA]|uniref:Uncharacterized protein n=1 Tax=Thanatephorus cucumeris (strain AG1-IA) TaxID=983506 RepID=L8WVP1_THACA|nr:hypothetical protein AG1IA_03888 [Rhizoctonia solani AG-1 IA]